MQDKSDLNSGRRATLAAIFEKPTRADVKWSDVAALVRALGGEVEERAGSRVAIVLNGRKAIIHTPHPGPVLKKSWVTVVRDFLISAGVTP